MDCLTIEKCIKLFKAGNGTLNGNNGRVLRIIKKFKETEESSIDMLIFI